MKKIVTVEAMFDLTRHRILQRLGESDMGKSWSWIESRVSELVSENNQTRCEVTDALRDVEKMLDGRKAKAVECDRAEDMMNDWQQQLADLRRVLNDVGLLKCGMEPWQIARACKQLRQERDDGKARSLKLVLERDQAIREAAAFRANFENELKGRDELQQAIRGALNLASNRWSEWGDRAVSVAEALEVALEQTKTDATNTCVERPDFWED